MTDDTHQDIARLDDLLRAAQEVPIPPPDFMARVLADALAAQPAAAAFARAARPTLWQRFIAALGGALGVAGLVSAATAGMLIGYVQVDTLLILPDAFGLSADAASLDFSLGFDVILDEETAQ